MIDVNLLDTDFRIVKPGRAASNLVRAFQSSSARYFVIGDRFDPGADVALVDRAVFVRDLVAAAVEDEAERERWEQELTASPQALSAFIVRHLLKIRTLQPASLDDLVERPLPSHLQRRVTATIANYLKHESEGERLLAKVIDGTATPPELWDPRSVVCSADGVVGVFDEAGIEVPGWRQLEVTRTPTSGRRAKHSAAPPPFKAHPRLTPAERPCRGKPLRFDAGLSNRPDADADEQQRIVIDDAQAGEKLLVVVSAEGATVAEPNYAELDLDLGASHTFTAQVADNADRVVLRAKSFFRNKLAGGIVKTLDVEDRCQDEGDTPSAPARAIDVTAPAASGLLASVAAIADVDLVVMVESEETGWVSWTTLMPKSKVPRGPFRTRLGDPEAFARKLAGIRSAYGDAGSGAHDELYGVECGIARTIPSEVVEVIAPLLRQPTAPAILLLTDQPFVPWELARLAPSATGLGRPTFLGEVARVGRWWTGSSTPVPRSSSSIQRLSAVAASQYALGTNYQTLVEARNERAWLAEHYHAQAIEAKQPDVDAWLDTDPRPPGHLGHIALHGFSDPTAGAQGVVLGDGSVLTPYRLAGESYDGLTPRFEMLFLNACQVGTAGEWLGRIAGFPGAMLSGGACGFIGPLWEVQDGVAREVAADFYRRTLDGKEEVGEALRAIRASASGTGSITPWAYLYYGHPRLQLTLTQ